MNKLDFEQACYPILKLKPELPISLSTRRQLALAYFMHQLESQEKRRLFMLTLTYKLKSDFAPKQNLLNRNFIRFYCHYFLPFLFQSKYYSSNKRILQQPITFSFLDEPEGTPHAHEPESLHHHAIVAAHESTLPRLSLLLGTNTFKDIDPNFFIATSDFKPCNAFALPYASKCLNKYPDFLMCPKRLQSVLEKTTQPELATV